VSAWLLLAFLTQERTADNARCIANCHESQADDWKSSIHFFKGTDCIGCHGADTIDTKKNKPHLRTPEFLTGVKAKWTDSPNLCKKCHQGVYDEFARSQHFASWEDDESEDGKRRVRGCLACHDYHKTATARGKEILASKEMGCAKCHRPATKQIAAMTKYTEQTEALERAIASLTGALHEEIPGISWTPERGARETAAQKLREFRTRQHFADFDKTFKELEKEIPPAVPPVEKALSAAAAKKRSLSGQKKLGLSIFLVLMAVTLLLARSWCVRTFGQH